MSRATGEEGRRRLLRESQDPRTTLSRHPSRIDRPFPLPRDQDYKTHSLDSNRNLTKSFRVSLLTPTSSPSLHDELRQSLDEFSDDLLRICHLNSLSRRSSHHLSEEEAFIGTISSSTSKDPRMRREATTRLQEQTEQLFEAVRMEVGGAEEGEREERMERAWAGWEVAVREDQTRFGVKSFAYVCMGVLLKLIEEEGEEE